jgi:hypothetical protein
VRCAAVVVVVARRVLVGEVFHVEVIYNIFDCIVTIINLFDKPIGTKNISLQYVRDRMGSVESLAPLSLYIIALG